MSEKSYLNVAYTSVGWPLSLYPNGVVSYLDNLFEGFEHEVSPCVFTEMVGDNHAKDKNLIIDLSRYALSKNLAQKAYRKVIYNLNIPYFELLGRSTIVQDSAKKAAAAIKHLGLKLDIFETEEYFGSAYFLAKEIKVPIVTRLHGPHFILGQWEDVSYLRRSRVDLEGKAIRCSSGVTSPSKIVLEMTRAFYDFEMEDAKVIPNPVKPPKLNDFWQLSNCSKREILFVGRFDLIKGADLMLSSFAILARANLDLILNFVGPDVGIVVKGKKLSFWEYVKEIIPEENIRLRVHFLGHVDQKKIAELRKNATVTVVSSRFESFGISLVEALAAGCPVVATSVGAIPEIIQHGFNGLLAETESAESIAENVQYLLNNPNRLIELSINAAEDVRKRFYPKVVASQMAQYYADLLV